MSSACAAACITSVRASGSTSPAATDSRSGRPPKPSRNSAATTPNSATNAGSRIDWDIAAAKGSCRNAGSAVTAPSPPGAGPAAGISAPIRDVMNAAIPALPSTEPT
jgi:hypothetical protein